MVRNDEQVRRGINSTPDATQRPPCISGPEITQRATMGSHDAQFGLLHNIPPTLPGSQRDEVHLTQSEHLTCSARTGDHESIVSGRVLSPANIISCGVKGRRGATGWHLSRSQHRLEPCSWGVGREGEGREGKGGRKEEKKREEKTRQDKTRQDKKRKEKKRKEKKRKEKKRKEKKRKEKKRKKEGQVFHQRWHMFGVLTYTSSSRNTGPSATLWLLNFGV